MTDVPHAVIDAHHHLWRVDRGDYGWLTPKSGIIYRDYEPQHLVPLLARHGINRTILVQAAPTVAETEFMLEIAAETHWVSGVVGWVDFEAPDAPEQIGRLAQNPLLVGLRPMVQSIADDDWLLRPSITPAVRALAAHGLVFDALVLPRHLPRLDAFALQHKDVTIVVDHLAKPFIKDRILDPWRKDMTAVAAHPHVVCKLSGMATEAKPDWTVDDLRPYAEHVLGAFGRRRVLWGSDWPVVDLAGGYDRWREASLALLAGYPADERAAVLGGNAARVYLNRRGRR